MKRFISFLLCIAVVMSLVSFGCNNAPEVVDETPNPVVTQEPDKTEEPVVTTEPTVGPVITATPAQQNRLMTLLRLLRL